MLKRLLILLCLTPTLAMADDADQLLERLSGLEALTGRFEQRQYPEGSDSPLLSEGHFRLLRPGYFAWEIETPDSQLILATPEFVWQHDRDLETVTRRPVDAAGMSPLQVLGGDAEDLRAGYRVEALAPGSGGDFRLTPVTDEAGFRSLDLQLDGGVIAGMTIIDNLGQRVEVTFGDIDRSPGLTAADFSFTPPPDADLFYHDE